MQLPQIAQEPLTHCMQPLSAASAEAATYSYLHYYCSECLCVGDHWRRQHLTKPSEVEQEERNDLNSSSFCLYITVDSTLYIQNTNTKACECHEVAWKAVIQKCKLCFVAIVLPSF